MTDDQSDTNFEKGMTLLNLLRPLAVWHARHKIQQNYRSTDPEKAEQALEQGRAALAYLINEHSTKGALLIRLRLEDLNMKLQNSQSIQHHSSSMPTTGGISSDSSKRVDGAEHLDQVIDSLKEYQGDDRRTVAKDFGNVLKSAFNIAQGYQKQEMLGIMKEEGLNSRFFKSRDAGGREQEER